MKNSGGIIDVSNKDITIRTSKAIGTVCIDSEAYAIMKSGDSIKGDVLVTAKIAAVQAVKLTSSIIPLCHSLLIEAVDVVFLLNEQDTSVTVTVTVKSSGKTGVEMEALTGVSIACLTIYDMLKYAGKDMVISQIKLLEKTGGKSGDYKRQN
jgi:cyclic pyranopterin phosphate synthase